MAPCINAERSQAPEIEELEENKPTDFTLENGRTEIRTLSVRAENIEIDDECCDSECVEADFASLNKQSNLSQYREAAREGHSRDLCKVVKTLKLSATEWNEFTTNFMMDDERIAGLGGTSSLTDPSPEIEYFHQLTEQQRTEWNRGAYRHVVLVTCGHRCIVADPQGYKYARYVGVNVSPVELLEINERLGIS